MSLGEFWVYPLAQGDTIADQDWVPLYFHRLLGSDFVAEACAGGASGRAGGFTAMLLWFEAVKQDPAGTLPMGDVALARLAGFGGDLDGWRAVRDLALYGWRPCSVETRGGAMVERLGHDTVADLCMQAFRRKDSRRAGRESAHLSHVKWKVRQQLEKLKRPARLIGDDQLITQVAQWLIDGRMHVTGDNVAAGLLRAGVPTLVTRAARAEGDEGGEREV
jgi:hypothetical protein